MSVRPILLLTRPEAGSERFAEQVKARFGGAVEIVIAPLQRIEWLDFAPIEGDVESLIFTSQSGVLGWYRVYPNLTLPAYCVGPQTAQAAQELGHRVVQAGGDAEALVELILSEKPNGPLLHVRGEHARGQVADRLTEAGIPTQERIAYHQAALPLSETATEALQGDAPVIAPLFSPRSVTLFAEAMPENCTPMLAVISPNAAERVDAMLRRRMIVAETSDAAGMLDAVEALLAAAAKG